MSAQELDNKGRDEDGPIVFRRVSMVLSIHYDVTQGASQIPTIPILDIDLFGHSCVRSLNAIVPLSPAFNPFRNRRQVTTAAFATLIGDDIVPSSVSFEDWKGAAGRIAILVAMKICVKSRCNTSECSECRSVDGIAGQCVDEAPSVRVPSGVHAGFIDAEVIP